MLSSNYQLCGRGQVLTWKCLLPVMCLYLMPFSSSAFANTPSTSCHYKQTQNNSSQKKNTIKLLVHLEPYRQTANKINPGLCSIKRLAVSLLFPGWVASLTQGTPQHFWQIDADRQFANTHNIYTPAGVERDTVRGKCFQRMQRKDNIHGWTVDIIGLW